MRNRIIFFSGGKASFLVAHWVKENFPQDNIILYFTDTKWEDEDLYRFIHEASVKMELPLLIHANGMTPLDLMRKNNFIYNSRIARCSIDLKVIVASKFLRKGKKPQHEEWVNKQYLKSENLLDNPVLYFGIGFSEVHRTKAIIKNWQPFETEFPLVDNFINEKEILNFYNIKQPRLYDMGFAHNNCKGRCVKGGQGHYLHLLKTDYVSFVELRDFEQTMNKIINTKNGTTDVKYAIMKKKGEPYFLQELEDDFKNQPQQIDMFEFGGCDCFIEDDLDMEEINIELEL